MTGSERAAPTAGPKISPMPQEVAITEKPRAWLLLSEDSPMTAFTVAVTPERDTCSEVWEEGGVR